MVPMPSTCTRCGGSNLVFLHRLAAYRATSRWFRCEDCGALSANPRSPSRASHGGWYAALVACCAVAGVFAIRRAARRNPGRLHLAPIPHRRAS